MHHVGKRLTFVLLLCLFPGAAMAQSAWPADPLSELVQSLSSSAVQPSRGQEAWVEDRAIQSAPRRAPERPRHRPKADTTRTIRAKAEITVVNEDQVIVRLTRSGIGRMNGAAVRH